MMQRFSSSDLSDYHDKVLTGIRFYAHEDATVYKAVVYKGGSFNGSYVPGTLILEQNISLSSLTMNAWNAINAHFRG